MGLQHTSPKIAKTRNCLSNAMHRQNINLPVCVCPSHFHFLSTRLQVINPLSPLPLYPLPINPLLPYRG